MVVSPATNVPVSYTHLDVYKRQDKMSVYTSKSMGDTIRDNSYVGRGIEVGKTADGKKAAIGYFIMGRSENAKNRVFKEEGDDAVSYTHLDVYKRQGTSVPLSHQRSRKSESCKTSPDPVSYTHLLKILQGRLSDELC